MNSLINNSQQAGFKTINFEHTLNSMTGNLENRNSINSVDSGSDNREIALRESYMFNQNKVSDNAVNLKKRMFSNDKNKLLKKIDNLSDISKNTNFSIEKSNVELIGANISKVDIADQSKSSAVENEFESLRLVIFKSKKEIEHLTSENSRLAKCIAEGQEDEAKEQRDKMNIQKLLDELQGLRAENNELHQNLMEFEGAPPSAVGKIDYNLQIKDYINEIQKKNIKIADLEFRNSELEKEGDSSKNAIALQQHKEIDNLRKFINMKKETNEVLIKEQNQRLNEFRRELDTFISTKERKANNKEEFLTQGQREQLLIINNQTESQLQTISELKDQIKQEQHKIFEIEQKVESLAKESLANSPKLISTTSPHSIRSGGSFYRETILESLASEEACLKSELVRSNLDGFGEKLSNLLEENKHLNSDFEISQKNSIVLKRRLSEMQSKVALLKLKNNGKEGGFRSPEDLTKKTLPGELVQSDVISERIVTNDFQNEDESEVKSPVRRLESEFNSIPNTPAGFFKAVDEGGEQSSLKRENEILKSRLRDSEMTLKKVMEQRDMELDEMNQKYIRIKTFVDTLNQQYKKTADQDSKNSSYNKNGLTSRKSMISTPSSVNNDAIKSEVQNFALLLEDNSSSKCKIGPQDKHQKISGKFIKKIEKKTKSFTTNKKVFSPMARSHTSQDEEQNFAGFNKLINNINNGSSVKSQKATMPYGQTSNRLDFRQEVGSERTFVVFLDKKKQNKSPSKARSTSRRRGDMSDRNPYGTTKF